MSISLKGRSLLTLLDYTSVEIRYLLDLAHTVKKEKTAPKRRFEGRTLALLFEKRSTRTRCAFETAFGEEGGHPVFLSSDDIQLGAKESLEDTARVLGRMFSAIQFRGFNQEVVETLADFSGIPVYNGLTDDFHPTQALADLMTVEEYFGDLNRTFVFVGDGRNNVANSLMIGCAKMNVPFRIISPRELFPDPKLVERCRGFAQKEITVTDNIDSGLKDAEIVYTDVWTSMGEEAQAAARKTLLAPFQVNSAFMAKTGNSKAIFLHCLPAVKGQEVTEDVFESEYSLVFDQAENRKHTIKAVMLATI